MGLFRVVDAASWARVVPYLMGKNTLRKSARWKKGGLLAPSTCYNSPRCNVEITTPFLLWRNKPVTVAHSGCLIYLARFCLTVRERESAMSSPNEMNTSV